MFQLFSLVPMLMLVDIPRRVLPMTLPCEETYYCAYICYAIHIHKSERPFMPHFLSRPRDTRARRFTQLESRGIQG